MRAKVWLEKTGRVDVNFTRYEVAGAEFMTFENVEGGKFSFDMAGQLHIDSGKTQFLAEIKNVTSEANQGVLYKEYLAKCYRTSVVTGMPHNFVWLTWHPFSQTSWTKLCAVDELKAAVELHKGKYVDTDEIDEERCEEIAHRLWLIVISDRQEELSMSNQMFGELKKALVLGVPR
jgi:hypothetical protein